MRYPIRTLLLLLAGYTALLGGTVARPRAAAAAVLQPVPLQPAVPVAVGGAVFHTPLDAVPAPDGETVYFVASTPEDQPGVFAVAAGGGAVTLLFAGAPLVTPRGIVVSSDGGTLYLADPGANGVFGLAVAGGSPTLLPTSVGTAARALDLVPVAQRDLVYVAGVSPTGGLPAVLQFDPTGTTALVEVAAELALANVDGLAVANDGTVYTAVPSADTDTTGPVLRLSGGSSTPALAPLPLGSPAGLALSGDGRQLLVSALTADGASEVVVLDLRTGATSSFSRGIEASTSSGGLHRALRAEVFAWANAFPPNRGTGTVFVIR